jgi:HEAT repeat protein
MTDTDKKSLNLIEILQDINRPFPPEYLHIFSDITAADLAEIKKAWPQIPVLRKINLLQDLEAMMESDTLLSCDDFARFALQDDNPDVRSHAINLLWDSEDPNLTRTFGEILTLDSNEVVRANAASALGKFVLMGELEEISKRHFERTVELLLNHYDKEAYEEVKQEILRALAYSGRQEIAGLIKDAYETNKKAWKIAALESMGRSADNRWKDHVLANITNEDADLQYEAIRASGELELKAARDILLRVLAEEVGNNDIYYQTIWALSKIGGASVRETLQDLLENSNNDEEIEVLEMALDNLDFTDENSEFSLF